MVTGGPSCPNQATESLTLTTLQEKLVTEIFIMTLTFFKCW
jgi:hypothetical protein